MLKMLKNTPHYLPSGKCKSKHERYTLTSVTCETHHNKQKQGFGTAVEI